jgi:UDP-N-acetylglucosamine 2-epimerase (non-hydrolysing)
MPEEHNRIQVDHISELLFAPSEQAKRNLLAEGVRGKVHVTGNTVIDAIDKYADLAEKKSSIKINMDDFILMTLHRAENVDDQSTLSSIVKAVLHSKENVLFTVHPHALKRLKEFGLYTGLAKSGNITLLEPVGYFDMIKLMKRCSYIITDSGGIQQEATSPKIRKKVLVARKTTDSPEAVKAGVAEVVGTSYLKILAAIKRTSKNPRLGSKEMPYGKGNAARQIVKIIRQHW